MISPKPEMHPANGPDPKATTAPGLGSPPSAESSLVRRPEIWRASDRHLLLGVSHPSDDPTRHRTFELRASYIAASNGWIARVAEQNVNEQRGDWEMAAVSGDLAHAYPSAAICLGCAVTWVLDAVDREAEEQP